MSFDDSGRRSNSSGTASCVPSVLLTSEHDLIRCVPRLLECGGNYIYAFQFYEGQADVYDTTRTRLLRGRNTMLSLAAAHLRALRGPSPGEGLVWIDIGGGTGPFPIFHSPATNRSRSRSQYRTDGQIHSHLFIQSCLHHRSVGI